MLVYQRVHPKKCRIFNKETDDFWGYCMFSETHRIHWKFGKICEHMKSSNEILKYGIVQNMDES